MKIIDETGSSKIAARIEKQLSKVIKQITITVSRHSPESIQLTGALPRTRGWHVALDIPIRNNKGQYKRKDYVKYIKSTTYKEIWIKVSTNGGHSKVYVR